MNQSSVEDHRFLGTISVIVKFSWTLFPRSRPDAVLHQRGHTQTGAHPARSLRQPSADPGQDQDPPRAAGRHFSHVLLLCF